MTLRRRSKQRYLLILCEKDGETCRSSLEKAVDELFGAISSKKAYLKLVSSTNGTAILSCSLESLESVLCAAALGNPPILTLSMSGSLHRLKKKIEAEKLQEIGSVSSGSR